MGNWDGFFFSFFINECAYGMIKTGRWVDAEVKWKVCQGRQIYQLRRFRCLVMHGLEMTSAHLEIVGRIEVVVRLWLRYLVTWVSWVSRQSSRCCRIEQWLWGISLLSKYYHNASIFVPKWPRWLQLSDDLLWEIDHLTEIYSNISFFLSSPRWMLFHLNQDSINLENTRGFLMTGSM